MFTMWVQSAITGGVSRLLDRFQRSAFIEIDTTLPFARSLSLSLSLNSLGGYLYAFNVYLCAFTFTS